MHFHFSSKNMMNPSGSTQLNCHLPHPSGSLPVYLSLSFLYWHSFIHPPLLPPRLPRSVWMEIKLPFISCLAEQDEAVLRPWAGSAWPLSLSSWLTIAVGDIGALWPKTVFLLPSFSVCQLGRCTFSGILLCFTHSLSLLFLCCSSFSNCFRCKVKIGRASCRERVSSPV